MTPVKVPIKVQKRSGFDLSHHNSLSQFVGSIVPVLSSEVIPNSKVYLRYAMAGSTVPLATDTYMKCYYDVRAFFVPMRLLWGGFEGWFSDYPEPGLSVSGGVRIVSNFSSFAPYFSIDVGADLNDLFGAGSLADYLGYKLDPALAPNIDVNIILSSLPFLAYHRICNDWFRQSNITREFYARPVSGTGASFNNAYDFAVAALPFTTFTTYADAAIPVMNDSSDSNLKFADGVGIFQLRSCNYDYDYFTNALPSAQLGNPMTVASVNNFTIPALRVANSLQQFGELNMLAGSKEVDVVRARYGAHLSSGVAQRCVYLGGARLDISSRSVDVHTPSSYYGSKNPFVGSVGATGGKVYCQGTDVIIDGFTAQEPGYIMVVGMVIPKVTYGTGIRRYLTHYTQPGSLVDMANPLLQNVGNQPIYDYELTSSLGVSSEQSKVFGYTDRYAEFMSMEDEVHGLLQYGSSLQSFIVQRAFQIGDSPVISTNFLSVPKSALDGVAATSSDLSKFGFWCQFAFDFRVSQPLAQYSLPSLQNPAYEHGNTIMVHRGGFRF